MTYHHSASTVGGDGCSVGSSSIAGMAFYQGASNYPAEFEDALFFSDYSRKCMWVMFPDVDGNPDPASTEAFANTVATGPVDLQIGPDGNLYYVDFNGGRIMRVKYGLNAVASATPTSGTAPLLVDFNGSATTPAQAGDDLVYAWDLDGDGEYDDSSEVSPSHTFTTPGTFTARLRVTDERDAVDFSDPIQISAGNTAPTAVIDTPLSSLAWKVNDAITFGGHGDDAQEEDQKVPEENLEWVVRIQHCPSDCHPHTYQTFSGMAGGSFPAPDHEYPAHLEIELTATDSQGLAHTTTVSIHPETVSLQFQTIPTGRQLSVGTFTGTAPFSRTVIRNSGNEVDALAPQGTFPNVWDFGSWSDGGAEQHSITASASATYTATFATHADLSISASASPEPVGAGAALTYTLTVANAGPSQASSLSVSHSLPAGSSFQSASGAGWACSGTGPVTCTMDSLGIASAAPISIAVTAPPDAGAISASSSVSSATADSAAANNSASTTSNVFARADLSVTQSGVPASVCSGQPISYTLNVNNAGPSAATSVSVTDVLPAGASLVSAAGSGWACSGTTTVTCTRASLAVGAAPAITVAITAPASAGTATNSVSVASATNDPSSANDSAAASTTVKPIPAPPTATNSGETCTGDPLQLFASAVAGATYAWTGPNGFSSTLQNPTIPNATPAASGTYSVTVTVEGCTSAAATTNAHVHPIPSAIVSGTAAICAGTSTTIQAVLTGTGPWTVVWSDGVTQSNVASSPVTRSVSPATTTTYTITTFSDIYCVGTDTGAAVITVAPIPTATVTGTAQVCAGSSTPIQAALTGTGPWTVVWSDGFTQSNVLASPAVRSVGPAATTTYTVTAVSDASCAGGVGSGGAVVTVQPPPTATVSGTAAICAGSSTTIQAVLTGTGPWTVVWSDGFMQSNVVSSPATRSVGPAATTTYTVTSVTDTQCAASGAGSAVVTIAPRPTAVASGSAEICPGGTTPLSGSGGASCLWAPAAGLSDAASCSPTASPSATTTYTLTVTDAGGCVSSNAPAVTITVNPIPSPPAAGNGGEVCVGDTLQLTASTIAGASYAWTGPNGFTSTLQNPTISNATTAASGLYSVSVTVAGCGSSEATTSALVRPLPTALVSGDATICAEDSTQLSVVLGGIGPWNLTWSDGHVQSAQTSPAIRNVSPSETTTYTVTAIADAHCAGPGAGAAAIVVGTPVDAPAITAPLSAAVDAIGLDASVSDHEGSTYAWTVSSGAITSGQGSSAITFDAGPAGTTMTVSVVETNTTCISPAATHTLQVDFLDVPPPHIFHDYVNTIARRGVTAGCGEGNFCPGGPNTREQIAVFLLKSKFGADYVPPPAVGVFSDVPIDSTFAPWVEKLAALQISVGCGGGKFCPGQPVTRGQMAVSPPEDAPRVRLRAAGRDGDAFRRRPAGTLRRLDRGSVQPGRHRRLPGLPAALLPGDPRHPRADGGVPRQNLRAVAPFELPPRQTQACGPRSARRGLPLACGQRCLQAGVCLRWAARLLLGVYRWWSARRLDRGSVQPGRHRRLPGLPAVYCPATPVTRGQMAVFLVRTFGL